MAKKREGDYQGNPCARGHSGLRNMWGECIECKAIRDAGRTIYYQTRDAERSANVAYRAMRNGSTVPDRPMPTHCELCGREPTGRLKTLVLDHCHESKEFRAWLCDPCNRGLGFFKDNPVLLRKAADMIENHRIEKEIDMSVQIDKETFDEVVALRKDALRYRWLRRYGDPKFDGVLPTEDPSSPEHMDAMIDAFIIKEGLKGV
jgi:hypothetical protein